MKEKPELIRQILAKNIKKQREILGLTQERLAESADLSLRSVNDIEGCRMWVSDKSLTRIAKALNTDIFELFVPYHAKLTKLPAALLTGLRQNIMADVKKLNEKLNEQLNSGINSRFNEAFKAPLYQYTQEEPKPLQQPPNMKNHRN